MAYGLWGLMPPLETRQKPEPDVWLDDALWIDARRSRSRQGDDAVAVEITVSTGVAATDPPPFYDLEREHHRPEPAFVPPADGAPDPGEGDGLPLTDQRAHDAAVTPRAPFAPAAPVGDVPGLLRRPLVEVQRTPPERGVDRPRPQRPDVLAIVAIALTLIVLISAVIASHG